MTHEPTSFSIAEVSNRIKNGEISPVELIENLFSRIMDLDKTLNAFVTIDPQYTLNAAEKAEKEIRSGRYRGPLHGIPIGVKDIIDTKGLVTTYGSSIFQDNMPKQDATVVSRLKKAGAIIIGKTNTHEFALGVTTNNLHYGPTKNPWNPELIPGGSSGGSAVATVANFCFAALGTDTGGSVRIPAAFCGLVGLKPTYGRVSLHGIFPLATGLDHVGPITRTVTDVAILLKYMAGFDEKDPRSSMEPVSDYPKALENVKFEALNVAVPKEIFDIPLDPEVRASYNDAVKKVEGLGAEISEVKLVSSDIIEKVSRPLLLAEAAMIHSELLANHSDKYGSNVIDRFIAGQNISTDKYIRALRHREEIIREIEMLFKKVDFLMSPSVQIKPPKIGQKEITLDSNKISVISGCTRFTRLGNLTGIPSIVIPFGYSSDSLPLSIQLMAPKFHEIQLLKFAYAFEESAPSMRNIPLPI